MSLKMVLENKPKTDNIIMLHETVHASALKEIAITLNLGKPPDNILPKALFEKINGRLDEMSKTVPYCKFFSYIVMLLKVFLFRCRTNRKTSLQTQQENF